MLFSVATSFWQRIRTPYGSFLAATVVVTCLMGCVGDHAIQGLLCILLLWTWCSYALIYSGLQNPKRQAECLRRTLQRMFVVVGCLAVIIGAIINHWPLRWRFMISRPELDQLADRVEGGLKLERPRAVGLFAIKSAAMRGSVPCLWIDSETCFARCAPEQVQGFNLWSTESMNDRWQLINED
ncbi:MAG TPA: hypothetical protein VMV10_22085 [Pirellulales bacterium]|nr:hypothetical protein [Pirellulales bacterium]